jgi:hypothetical protein
MASVLCKPVSRNKAGRELREKREKPIENIRE